MPQKTPLYDLHLSHGAKMVPFGNWSMPVSYKGVLAEHHGVRQDCGLFDVSHMGELVVSGHKSFDFLQAHTMNDLSKLAVGQGQYSALLNHDGGMIDDIIIYRKEVDHYFVCVNAANIEKDYQWMDSQSKKWAARVSNESENWGQLAIQGPRSAEALSGILSHEQFSSLPYMGIQPVRINQWHGLLARTGYTGEKGYELYVPAMALAHCWERIMSTTPLSNIQPIGLGARDTLRLEACYLLYGNDMDEKTSPFEAGVGWACKLNKGNFVGREALLNAKSKPMSRSIFAFKMEDDGIPRHDMAALTMQDQPLGKITSGSVLPTVGGAGGMALLDPSKIKIGDTFYVDIRGKLKLARVMPRPLYQARIKTP